jgi:hypothetical protein
MGVDDVVSVSISVADSAPSVAGFGVPLILAYHDNFVGEVRQYNANPAGLTSLLSDGFTSDHDAYRKAAAICAQTPHCSTFKVGVRAAANQQSVDITPAWATEGRTLGFDVDVGGTVTTIAVTPQAGDLIADVCDDLVTELGGVSGLTPTDNTTHVTVEPDDDEVRIYLRNVLGCELDDTSADAGIATDLAANLAVDDDWYGLLIDSNSAAEILAAAAWALTNERLFGSLSIDSDILTSDGGVAADLLALTNHNTYVLSTRDGKGQCEAGLMGRQLSRAPGSSTWALKTVSGAVADAYTATELGYARAAKAITYQNTKGISHTFDGFATSGRFLDITRGIAWTKARMQEAVIAALTNNEKLGFTNAGASVLESAVSGVLASGEKAKLYAPGWSVTRPDVSAVSAANKTARLFPDIRFSAVLQGAIHSVEIDGTVTP